ncbi:MAG: type II toxin-antitoxin system Xre/ParS family antitoxin [Bacteroidales bacterium]|jgi:putative toxin-antitoxin system antitoxin component (TIGR02293 family)
MTKAIEQKLDKEVTAMFKNTSQSDIRFSVTPKITYNELLSDKMFIISAIRAGIPFSLFSLIRETTPFSETEWAGFLDISTKSLQRYKAASRHFKPMQSEKIIELAEVTKLGSEVFEDMDKLKLWLNAPNFALGNNTPVELLKDSYGKDLVMGELTRIHYGIFV